MWASRFKQYSLTEQQQRPSDSYEADGNLAFTIPREYIVGDDVSSTFLFHGGLDSPSLNAYDPICKQPVQITKYLCLRSKTSTDEYLSHLYERMLLTSDLSHSNVRRILSWYIADACLYSVTEIIHRTLRHAIESERFSLERLQRLSSQIIQGTIYLQSKNLCPLTPWYTTNIELTRDDRIRLCSPTISTRKLNGGIVEYHHLWRHAPECLIRMILEKESHLPFETIDQSKEDVWSIACIIIEMLINTILFRPQNDDPILQLLCIVQYVGGLSIPLLERFPSHVKKFFAKIKCDPYQLRLHRLLQQIFREYKFHHQDTSIELKENLMDLLKQMFQFQSIKRLSLTSLLDHPFFAVNSMKSMKLRSSLVHRPKSIRLDHLVHLSVKFNLEHSRWVLSLKERCLFEVILRMETFSSWNLSELGLSRSLENDLRKLISFLTGLS